MFNADCCKIVIGSVLVLTLAGPGRAAEASADGAKTYGAKCASCHAKDGKGNPAMAKVFKVDPEKLSLVSEAELAKSATDQIKVTTDGSGKMPAYKGKLTEAEIQAVVEYTRTLAPVKK